MSDTTVDSGTTWIRRYHPAPDARGRVVCFPHAGGAATSYHSLSAGLAPEWQALAVQYPGRQDRRAEPPLTDLRVLADRVFEALGPWLDGPVVLFGHSMGSAVAFEVARRMEAAGQPPRLLVASGRRAPSDDGNEKVHLRDDQGLVAEISELSGTDARLLADPEMLAALLPSIRADYQAIETYLSPPDATVACPVEMFVGEEDPQVTPEQALAWRRHTTGPFALRRFPGGHFYLTERPGDVLARLAEAARAHV